MQREIKDVIYILCIRVVYTSAVPKTVIYIYIYRDGRGREYACVCVSAIFFLRHISAISREDNNASCYIYYYMNVWRRENTSTYLCTRNVDDRIRLLFHSGCSGVCVVVVKKILEINGNFEDDIQTSMFKYYIHSAIFD